MKVNLNVEITKNKDGYFLIFIGENDKKSFLWISKKKGNEIIDLNLEEKKEEIKPLKTTEKQKEKENFIWEEI